MSRATLPTLDSSLYPQVWEQQTFTNPQSLLMAMLTGSISLDPKDFTKQLLANDIYQEWINFTVFGRYIQRSFAAFYQQSEDSFNMDIPQLFRHELMRHAQYLPIEQTLFFAGNMPKSARRDKLFTSTINPATAALSVQQLRQYPKKLAVINSQELIINQIRIVGKQVVGFAIRHNKRTSERTRNEVLILDFHDLRLVNEQVLNREGLSNTAMPDSTTMSSTTISSTAILLRSYELR